MNEDWILYNVETEDEYKIVEGNIVFKNSGGTFAVEDFEMLREIFDNGIEGTKKFEMSDVTIAHESLLEEEDYTFISSIDEKFLYVIYIEDNSMEITAVNNEGLLVSELVLTSEDFDEIVL